MKGNNGNRPVQRMNINLKLEDTRPVTCSCGNGVFVSGMALRYVSPLQSANGEPAILEVPLKICSKCGQPYTLQDMLKGIAASDAATAVIESAGQ